MRDLDAVWKLARVDLIVPADDGGQDIFLWEHSVRIAKSCQYLARLPEAQAHQPDLVALLAGALYHDAGWITRLQAGEIKRYEMLLGAPNESTASESARLMQKSLRGVIPDSSLHRAADIVRFRTQPMKEFIEGLILVEAENLEEFGLGFVWMAIRRGVCGGKGVQAVLDAWKRRTEYHFWTARLQDTFRFEATRQLARQRLGQLELLMDQMMVQHNVEDVRLLVEKARGCPLGPVSGPGETEKRGRSTG